MLSKFLTAVLALTAVFKGSDACSCIPVHLQPIERGCPQRFLSIVHIKDVRHNTETGENHYIFDVIADSTPDMAAKTSISKFPSIDSASSSAACGVGLEKGKNYLLFGGLGHDTARLGLCGSQWQELPKIPTHNEAQKLMEDIFKERCVPKKISQF